MRLRKPTSGAGDASYYLALLAEIDRDGEGLSEWEIQFVEDLVRRQEDVAAGRYRLTKPQQFKLEQIHERRVS